MILDPRMERGAGGHGRRGIWIAAGILLTALVIGAAVQLSDFEEKRPNLYDPARVALVEAKRRLSEVYHLAEKEKELADEMREAHRSMDAVVRLLENAEKQDPADQTTIDALSLRLKTLEDDRKISEMSAIELHDAYQEIGLQLEALIKRRE